MSVYASIRDQSSIAAQGAKKRRFAGGVTSFSAYRPGMLVIIVSVIASKREKPIPVTTENSRAQDDSTDRLRDWKNTARN